MKTAQPAVMPLELTRVTGEAAAPAPDLVVAEEPLEIRLAWGPEGDRQQKALSVTMRTPGHDFDLAIGFLFTEGIIHSPQEVQSVSWCQNVDQPEAAWNIVKVELAPETQVDWQRLERNFYTSSSCGVCGKSSLEAVQAQCPPPLKQISLPLSAAFIHQLGESLQQQQLVFAHTGGLHAAALFNASGEVIALREDVGRHNAVDKLIGGLFMQKRLPLSESLLWVSGRAGFELVQKAAMAGIPAMVSVGAPTSLSVNLARAQGMVLVGFARPHKFNIYSGAEHFHFI